MTSRQWTVQDVLHVQWLLKMRIRLRKDADLFDFWSLVYIKILRDILDDSKKKKKKEKIHTKT